MEHTPEQIANAQARADEIMEGAKAKLADGLYCISKAAAVCCIGYSEARTNDFFERVILAAVKDCLPLVMEMKAQQEEVLSNLDPKIAEKIAEEKAKG